MFKIEKGSLQALSEAGRGKGLEDLGGSGFPNPVCEHGGTQPWTGSGSTLESVRLLLRDPLEAGMKAEWRDEAPPSLGSSGVSLLLLLLQDVDLSPHSFFFFFLDDKQVIHVQGRGPIPAFTDGETVKKPIPVNTELAGQTKPPYGKSK